MIADECVCEDEELPHQCGERHLGRLPRADEALIHGFKIGVEAGGDESGHVKSVAQVRPPSANHGASVPFAGLPRHGRQTGEAGGGFAFQRAELRRLRQQRCGGDRRDAGNAGED